MTKFEKVEKSLNEKFCLLKERIEKCNTRKHKERKFLDICNERNEFYKEFSKLIPSRMNFYQDYLDDKEEFLDFDTNKYFNQLNPKEIELIPMQYAYEKFLNCYEQSTNIPNQKVELKSGIKWLGDDQNEFCLLIYTLFESNIISNNGKGKTKLVKDIANYFDYKLTDSWQKDVTQTFRRNNNDYTPTIIDKINDGFKILKNKTEDRKNKKNRNN